MSLVWNQAFRALRDADRIIFCGYSFPDADMHIKYLFKRAQLNRDREVRPLGVLLVNHYAGKSDDLSSEECRRFSRFLGEADLVDTRLSFQDFATNPRSVIEQPI